MGRILKVIVSKGTRAAYLVMALTTDGIERRIADLKSSSKIFINSGEAMFRHLQRKL